MPNLINKAAAAVAVVSLAVTLVAAGFAACAAFPQTTEMLAEAFSGDGNPDTPFSHDELVHAAVAAREYTVGSNDREAVLAAIRSINESADTPYADADDDELAAAPEEYTLTSDALSHLDDVYRVVAGARIVLAAIAILAVAACAHVAIRVGRRALGGVLLAAGIAVVAVFALLAAWVVVDFNGFFAAFHSLFFANGTWTFSYDSLLITMYPPAFWMGMGAVWLAATGLLSIATVVVGMFLRRKGA
ncbi:hypothetical protein B5F40_04920 [Gordonibacter sp. An230]|uniref:lipoprotein intramolecular transacylase Lit n=1 Tax=Gordonibacter sp. An230 TaxID=1965592 RepID=UPI000B3810AD|nr:DUF1461 domain-containing protein [Gordonibacter sp. An230]OUO90810.1 hypothetical protein B5F40_04920 [Gordonibacter sp. An230]